MLKRAAIQYFGTQAAIARALEISTAAVAKWDRVVPLESATAIEVYSDGKCPVDRSLYPALVRAETRGAEATI